MNEASLRGKVELVALDKVRPNPWNPNKVPEHIMESIRHGFREDGWIVSQALLVWATDDKGKEQNLIIDGEHRHRAAVDVGLKKGPMVLLKNLPELDAKALTVKLNQKRGDWDLDELSKLLNEINVDLEEGALKLGFSDDELAKLLIVPIHELPLEGLETPDATSLPKVPDGPGANGTVNGMPGIAPTVRMVQLFLDANNFDLFQSRVTSLAARYGTKSVTDTVLRALEEEDING